MKIQFDEDGRIKLPKNIEKDKKIEKERFEIAENNPDKVIIDYEEETPGYVDRWIITLPNSVPKSILFKLKKWTDKQVEISSGGAWIEQNDENEFILTVRGNKNRCTWAHSFLQGLNTALLKDYKTKLLQKGTCKHKFYVRRAFKGTY